MHLLKLLNDVWKTWNLRGFILFSFSLQCILLLGSAWRIQFSKSWVHRLIWFAYLLSEWAAYYAIGLIMPIGPRIGGSVYMPQDQYTLHIHSFWAPFLLLHIAGPYNIAGFNLEDNKLWDRSVLHLVVQAVATGYVIYRSIPHNLLLAPMLMMFLAALTRYVGKICALYKASQDAFRRSVMKKNNSDDNFIIYRGDMPNLKIVTDSYCLFKNKKVIFAGFSILSRVKDFVEGPRYNILAQDAKRVFTMMEIELSLAYDLFYTKIWWIIKERIGALLHLISLISEVGALVHWVYAHKHGRYHPVDIRITNIILVGGVVIDVYSMMMLLLSNHMIPRLLNLFGNCPIFACSLEKVLVARDSKYGRYLFMVTRWSRSIKQFDFPLFAKHHLSHSKRRIRLEELVRNITSYDMYVSTTELSDGLMDYIFKEITERYKFFKSKMPEDSEEKNGLISGTLIGYVEGKYGRGDIMECFKECRILLILEFRSYGYRGCQKFNTTISRYLMYLLFRQPNMIWEGVQSASTLEFMIAWPDNISRPDILKEVVQVATDLKERAETDRDSFGNIMDDLIVDFLLYTAIHCRPWRHIEQLGKGGELLTIVWLIVTSLGFTIEPFEFFDKDLVWDFTRWETTNRPRGPALD